MRYRVIYHFSDGSSEDILDEVFNSKLEAELAAREGATDYAAGVEVLKDAGELYSEEEIVGWDIVDEKADKSRLYRIK